MRPTDSEPAPTKSRKRLPPQIEERITRIRQRWATLREEWDSDELIRIHSALSELAEFAEHEDFHALADAAFSAEVYLSSFVGTQMPMTPNQRASADSLLAELTADQHFVAEGTGGQSPRIASDEIFMVGPAQGPLRQVAEVIGKQGLKARQLKNAAETQAAMETTLPVLIIADIQSIPDIEPLLEQLAHLRQTHTQHIPLIYVSDTDNLEMRIRTIRAAGEAFFSPPFDSERFIQTLAKLQNRNGAGKHRILIIEDDASQAEFSASILNKAGFETSIVTDPMQTLDRIREFAPDLIIMDIYMPEIDGIELTSVIRGYNEYAGIPIIFLSGEQDSDRQVDALSVGGDDFITKPIRPKHLIAIVKNRIRRALPPGPQQSVSTGTRLLTKSQFIDRVTTLLSTAPQRTQSTLVLLISPDHIDALRTQLGEDDFGQLMLALIQLLEQQLSGQDTLAKLDQTTLAIASRRSNTAEMHDLAVRLHKSISTHRFSIKGTDQSITVAMGLACAASNDKDAHNLLSHAHTALEEALLGPGGQTVDYAESSLSSPKQKETRSQTGEDISPVIRHCLENDDFVVLYQPMLDLQVRGSENYEITLRIPNARGDLIQPAVFQGIARQAGLAEAIDKWLIVRALKMLKERRSSARETRFFLSQSGAAIQDPGFGAWLAEQLRRYQVVGTGMILDYPLASLSHDLKAAKTHVSMLHKMDIAVCISEFPEKPAAFKLLRYIQGSYIRIAQRLLKADRKTITSIVQEAHNAKAKVIISHIDDPKSIDLHWSSGGDLLQGDFIQPPIDNLDYDFSQVVI